MSDAESKEQERLLGRFLENAELGARWDTLAPDWGGSSKTWSAKSCCPAASCCYGNAGFEMGLGEDAGLREL